MTDVRSRCSGRPRKFPKQEVTDRLRSVFLKHGYSATTLDDLEEAAQTKRPSLYKTFGDKRGMYLAALGHASQLIGEDLGNALAKEDIRDAVKSFYATALRHYKPSGAAPLGCYVVGTALTEAPNDVAIRDALYEAITFGDRVLTSRFAKAIAAGQLPENEDPARLGWVANSLLHGLAVRVRAGFSDEDISSYIDAAVASLIPAD